MHGHCLRVRGRRGRACRRLVGGGGGGGRRLVNFGRAGAQEYGHGRDDTNGSEFFHNRVVTC